MFVVSLKIAIKTFEFCIL